MGAGYARHMPMPAPVPLPASEADRVRESAALLQSWAADGPLPRVAVVLGSGWGGVVGQLQSPRAWPYAALPAFPAVGVGGHAGQLWLGQLPMAEGPSRPVWLLAGRAHAYEHGDAAVMRGAIRSLAAAGVQTLVLTNAAGSLRPGQLRPGDCMLLADHLNLAQRSPLVGDAPGPDDPTHARRFVDLAGAYDASLRARAQAAAARLGRAPLREGVYAWMLGPQFETPAEIRMLQALGADAVGMSTVPETIVARQAGLRVLACALITNLGCGLDPGEALSHAHTLAQAAAAGEAASTWLAAVLADIA